MSGKSQTMLRFPSLELETNPMVVILSEFVAAPPSKQRILYCVCALQA